MRRALGGLIFFAVVGFAPEALAQDSPPQTVTIADAIATIEHSQLARQYVEIGGSEDQFLNGADYGFRQAARAQGVEFTPQQWQRVRAVIREHYHEAAELFVGGLADFYVTHGQTEDLRAAIAYYSTPAGAHYVATAQEAALPLIAYLSSQGLVRLDQPPTAEALDAAHLQLGRDLATLLVDRMHEQERVAVNMTTLGVEGVEDYLARALASRLEASDLTAAITWARTPESQRLEGPSAERTLTIQTLTMRAVQTIDLVSLGAAIREIMNETPT